MPANLRTCADCSTQYALELSACPHCGSSSTVDEEEVVTKRLPLFITVSCADCGRGPWVVRLNSVASGLIALPTLACASCGSRVPVTWPPEEEPMSPKITVKNGATNVRDAGHSPAADASAPQVVAEDDLGHPTSVEPAAEADAPKVDEVQNETKTVEDADPYAGMTLAELRNAAEERELPSYGTKAQLADRLREADAS